MELGGRTAEHRHLGVGRNAGMPACPAFDTPAQKMATTLRHFQFGGFTTSPFSSWRTNDATTPVAHPKSATCNVAAIVSPKSKWQRPRTTRRHGRHFRNGDSARRQPLGQFEKGVGAQREESARSTPWRLLHAISKMASRVRCHFVSGASGPESMLPFLQWPPNAILEWRRKSRHGGAR